MYLWVPDRSSSNLEWNFGGRISSSFDVPGSGEGPTAESENRGNEGLGSAARRSSWVNSHSSWRGSDSADVAKMASHAIFQYNVLAIDDTHNTWTNMIVKMIILRLLGSSDDKDKIGVARTEGTRIEETVKKSKSIEP